MRRILMLALLCVGLVAAAPTAANARGGHHGGDRAGSSYDRADVPRRVASRITRAQRALDRASDAVDDENATGAASALKSVRGNLASALKSAKRRAASDNGPAALGAVASTQNKVIEETVSLFDGQSGTTVDALATTLDSAITGRDDAIATITGLTAEQQGEYEGVLSDIEDDVADEIDAIDEALADDTLTTEAPDALNSARAKLVATQTTVSGLTAAQSSSEDTSSQTAADEDGDGRDCPDRGSRGSRGSNGDSSTSGDSTEA